MNQVLRFFGIMPRKEYSAVCFSIISSVEYSEHTLTEILMFGLDGSGKTVILNQILKNGITDTDPTEGDR